MKNRFLKTGLILLCLAALIEISSYLCVIYLRHRGIIYAPFKVSFSEYEEYLSRRDKITGWPYPQSSLPANAGLNSPQAYISVYGDSFTQGAGAKAGCSYSDFLSEILNREVANYGVGGFGTDQAYLRFINNNRDDTPIVILGYSVENIVRNVNRYRPLLYYNREEVFGLKPRYIINADGGLKLIPLPEFDYGDFMKTISFPEKYFKYDFFAPGTQAGVRKQKFPFSICLFNVLKENAHVRAKLRGLSWYSEFYEFNHPSGALEVTLGIMKEFCREALKKNKKPLILIIPLPLDLAYFKEKNKWTYENLVRQLRERNPPFIDAGPPMIVYLQGKDLRQIGEGGRLNLHYNEEGYKIIARIVAEDLKILKQ